jgi:hypothetical protein
LKTQLGGIPFVVLEMFWYGFFSSKPMFVIQTKASVLLLFCQVLIEAVFEKPFAFFFSVSCQELGHRSFPGFIIT